MEVPESRDTRDLRDHFGAVAASLTNNILLSPLPLRCSHLRSCVRFDCCFISFHAVRSPNGLAMWVFVCATPARRPLLAAPVPAYDQTICRQFISPWIPSSDDDSSGHPKELSTRYVFVMKRAVCFFFSRATYARFAIRLGVPLGDIFGLKCRSMVRTTPP